MQTDLSMLFCGKSATILEVLQLFESSKKCGLPNGIALVVDNTNKLVGTVTEGDVRRSLLNSGDLNRSVEDVMQSDPITFSGVKSVSEIIELLPRELAKRGRGSKDYLSKIIIVDQFNRPIRIYNYSEIFDHKVGSHRHIVIIGMGYVGLTLALVMADAGFVVTGVEVNEERYTSLSNRISYVKEAGIQELLERQSGKNFLVSREIPEYGDVFIISVGTPVEVVRGVKTVVFDYLKDACEKVGKIIKNGNLVVLRSTVPIGTSRKMVKEILESESNLVCGIDFHLSFAPERTAEGKALRELRTLPQIVGGFNRDSYAVTSAIFKEVTPTIVMVDSLEVAEMAKLVNNTFRDYVFAYSNQIAKVAKKLNINVFDVIRAANEGYVRDPVPYPSPGVGGPCLTKDPYIFQSVVDEMLLDSNIFADGRRINESMHDEVVDAIISNLLSSGKNLSEARILICGLAFKGYPETGDIRNSSAVEIGIKLLKYTKNVFGFDFVADFKEINSLGISTVDLPDGFKGVDAVVFLNNHRMFEKINIGEMLTAMAVNPIVFDGWNLFRYEDVISVRPSTYIGLSFTKSSIKF